MGLRISHASHVTLVVLLLGGWHAAHAQELSGAAPPASIPTFSTDHIARQGFFYVGGEYVGEPGKQVMVGAMYVEVMVPRQIRRRYPLVMIHGSGLTGTSWLQTPDGREGWAHYFVRQGYVVYVVDTPTRGRSGHVPGVNGPLTVRTVPQMESFSNPAQAGEYPQAKAFSQWPSDAPKRGTMGDPVFDAFARAHVSSAGREVSDLSRAAFTALLERIGPSMLLTHQQGGSFAWATANSRPDLVKAIISVDPPGPPIRDADVARMTYRTQVIPDTHVWGPTWQPLRYDPPIGDPSELQPVLQEKPSGPNLLPCWRQTEPAHKLTHLQAMRVLILSGEASFRRPYVHCNGEWLNQAGVKTDFVGLESVGIRGNGHLPMIEKNSLEIAKFVDGWLQSNVR